MAAGLTIDGDKIDAFADFLEDRLAGAVTHALGERALLLDALLAPRGLTVDLVTAFDGGGPYGMGWPAPRVAAGPVRILKADVVGNGHVREIVSGDDAGRSEEHTSELQSLMRTSYAGFCLKKKNRTTLNTPQSS